MSHLVDASGSRTQKSSSEPALDSVSDRLRTALSFEANKPDSKDFPDLSSPVSPLPARPAATTSSSGSSGSVSGKPASHADSKRSDLGLSGRRSHSGELLLAPNEPIPGAMETRSSKPGHRRSGSVPLIYTGGSFSSSSTSGSGSGSSSASSPVTNVLPAGNICPSGKIVKAGMISRSAVRTDVLGSGTGNYGHGNIVRGGTNGAGGGKPSEVVASNGLDSALRRAMVSMDPEEVKRVGNEQYRKGQFAEALKFYDRAIGLCPDSAVCRSNRAAALTGLRRLGEAVKECEEALLLDPAFGRAHQRLASLLLRLGQVENARRHLISAGPHPDPVELQKLQAVERHLNRCADARKFGDWKTALKETDAAIAEGADSSAFWINENGQRTIFRFENAVAAAEKARQVDTGNVEVSMMLNNVRSVSRARLLGNELFNSGKFVEASIAYGEGLKYDPSNPVLYCNRAACRSKLGQWEKTIEDCNQAIVIQPDYTKALLRRAASYAKVHKLPFLFCRTWILYDYVYNGRSLCCSPWRDQLERWTEAVSDYEVLRKELPGDTEVAEALFHAQVALKTSRGEEVSNLKFGGEVEEIKGFEQFQAAITLPGEILLVDVNAIPAVGDAENVRTVPTFKIYKNGAKVRELICPSQQALEYSLRHYGL
ncbi:hypothetical protein BHE74_00038939 [Ensete ventricosum]|nr:hypothetical protein BHE74_00038939 [Ensete ventricosum]